MKEFVNNFENILYKDLPSAITSKQTLLSSYQIDIKGYNSIIIYNNSSSDIYIQANGNKIFAGNIFEIKGNENEIINDNVLNVITQYSSGNVYGIAIIKKKYI
jgi:hypothetical protein